MKKLLYSLLAVGTVAGLASCSSDEPMMSGNSDGKVSIEVKLPDFGTRFYGDQLQCNELIYTIFNADGDAIDGVTDVKQDAFGPGVTSETITLNLVPGETYMIAFYAHNKGSLFSAYSNGTIDVNYEKMNVNNEIDDAFYCYVPISTTATEPQSVTLNRAFAQINFGTNDFTNPLVQEVIGSLTASFDMEAGETGLYTSLDTKTNEVSVPQTDAVTITNSLTANTDFPVANYGNLTSLYVLVSPEEGQMLGKGTYTLNNGDKVLRTVNMANTPVRMNYRTNIYGSMLTTQIPVTVEIEPNFAGSNMIGPAVEWDGETKEITPSGKITYNGENYDLYSVSDPGELAWLAQNMDANSSADAYIQLQNNFDLNEQEWTPMFSGSFANGGFQGVFDGNGFTVRGLQITQYNNNGYSFIGCLDGGKVMNLNFEDISINYQNGSYAAAIGVIRNNASIENVNVKSGNITGYNNVGGICGNIYDLGSITNCTNNANISGRSSIGGICGSSSSNNNTDISVITNCTNNGNITFTISGPTNVGGIIGQNKGDVVGCTNTGKITSDKGTPQKIGGIVGWQNQRGSVKNCINEGEISLAGCQDVGGIVGLIDYKISSTIYHEVVEVSGCTNKASVLTQANITRNGIGGIVGTCSSYGEILNNNNYAPMLTAKTACVAGIVGQSTDTSTMSDWSTKSIIISNNKTSTTLDEITVGTDGKKDLYTVINKTYNTSPLVTLDGNELVTAP